MSVLRRRGARDAAPVEERATFSMSQLARALGVEPTGPTVGSIDEALRDAATWACVKVKAQGIAALPVDVVRSTAAGRAPAPVPQIISRPSALVPRRQWVFSAAASMFTDGNVFGLIVGLDSMGKPTQIELLAPEQVTQREVVDGVPQVRVDNVMHKLYPFGDVWHVAGEMVLPGSPFALSPVSYGAMASGTALAAEKFGGRFLTDSAIPAAILAPERDPGPEGAKAIKAAFVGAMNGTREPVVLPQSVKYERISVDPKDSQFIDLMRFEVEQTCRRHGVPPSMVYGAVSGQNVTYANVSQADLHYLKHTLDYPITLIEDALSALLPAPRVVKFNRDALLRADTLTRYQTHQLALSAGFRTVNEVRTLEDEAPFDGEQYDQPGGVAPASPAEEVQP